jgi:hypothetical protein
MNYPNHAMTTAGMQPASASISLPPISSIDFRTQQAHHAPPEVLQPMPPQQPPRQLPPLPHQQQQQHYYNGGARTIPHQPEYVHQQRAIYPGMQVGSPYQLVSTRIPLPSTSDPNLIVAPPRHKTKEVKRRTKTGCLTCRKRRIKVRSKLDFNFVRNVHVDGRSALPQNSTPGDTACLQVTDDTRDDLQRKPRCCRQCRPEQELAWPHRLAWRTDRRLSHFLVRLCFVLSSPSGNSSPIVTSLSLLSIIC